MIHPLYPFQTEARYQANTLLNASRHPVIVLPTGTGKTITAVHIIADRVALGRRVYVLVPQDEVFRQWVRDLSNAGLNPGTIADGKIAGASRMVYVCMPLTLINLLPMIPEAIYPDELVTDEAHHAATETIEEIYRFFPSALRIGLTATPRRMDGKPLNNLYTDIISTITSREAIEQGYLVKPLPVVPEDYYNKYMRKIPIVNNDYDPEMQARILGKPQIIGDVIGTYEHVFSGLPVLVACSTFDHAKLMTEMFNDAGWRFAHIHSDLPLHERRKMLSDIENKKLNGLCTVGIGIEGMDIPGLYGLLWLRRTLSLTIYLQFWGRILRKMKGKKYGIGLDFVGNIFIHGRPEADRIWSLEGSNQEDPYQEADLTPMRICPFCGVANAIENRFCHFCHGDMDSREAKELRARKLPAMIDGELVAVEDDEQAEKIRNKAERIKQEQRIAEEKEEERKKEAVEISREEKAGIIREGLFVERRKMFKEAVKNFL